MGNKSEIAFEVTATELESFVALMSEKTGLSNTDVSEMVSQHLLKGVDLNHALKKLKVLNAKAEAIETQIEKNEAVLKEFVDTKIVNTQFGLVPQDGIGDDFASYSDWGDNDVFYIVNAESLHEHGYSLNLEDAPPYYVLNVYLAGSSENAFVGVYPANDEGVFDGDDMIHQVNFELKKAS